MEAANYILSIITFVAFALKLRKDGVFSFLDPLFYLSIWSTLYLFWGNALDYGPTLGFSLDASLATQKLFLCVFYQLAFLVFMVILPSKMNRFREISISNFPRVSVQIGICLWLIGLAYMVFLTFTQSERISELPASRVLRYGFYLEHLCGQFKFSLAQQGLSFLSAFLSLRFRNRAFFLALIFPGFMMFLLGNRMEVFYVIMWFFLTSLLLKRRVPILTPGVAIFCILLIGLVREKSLGLVELILSGDNKFLEALNYLSLEFGYNNASIDVALNNKHFIQFGQNSAYALMIFFISLVFPQALGWVPIVDSFVGFRVDRLTDFYDIGFSLSQNILSEALLFGEPFVLVAPFILVIFFHLIKIICLRLGAFGLIFLVQMCIYSWLLFRGSGFLYLGKYVSMLWHYYFWILIPLIYTAAYRIRDQRYKVCN